MTKLFPFSHYKVHGSSMLPTLKPGQDILCFHWSYLFSKPKLGDIVVIEHQGRVMVKRVQMSSDRGTFVLGDNKQVCRCCGKNASTDSRSFGMIEKSEIVGKVIFV